jgi:FtsP/CotA-like multicopper oxidase with cupredoxin domain
MFMGTVVMVNGKVWPNMNVDRGQYRFRLLNGSNSRIYNLAFSNKMSFIMIGSDGGYLQAPATLNSLSLAPAERADIIVNFSSLAAGENVVLQNTLGETQQLIQIMQFTANNAQGTSPFDVHAIPIPFNPTLPGSTFPTLPQATKRRVLTLYEVAGANGSLSEALLDGQTWGAAISEMPELGATEEWVIVNPTMDAHPIHLHLVQFQLVNRQTLNASTAYLEDWIGLNGQPPFNHPTNNLPSLQPYVYTTLTGPLPQEQAWKDTITVNPSEVTTIRVRFAPQDGSTFPFDASSGPGYVWHCHLLEHEDNEMMRPYKVTNPTQSLVLPVTAAAVGGTAVALSLAYYYQQKKKKTPQNKGSLNQSVSSDGQTEMPQNLE